MDVSTKGPFILRERSESQNPCKANDYSEWILRRRSLRSLAQDDGLFRLLVAELMASNGTEHIIRIWISSRCIHIGQHKHDGRRPGAAPTNKSERVSRAWTVRHIPARGWLAIARQASRAFGRHDMPVRAAAISFFALFAIFPAIGAFVAFYGLVANPETIVNSMQALRGFVPTDVVIQLIDQMQAVSMHAVPTLVFAGTFSLVIAVWSAQQGVVALMVALDAACGETVVRGRLGLSDCRRMGPPRSINQAIPGD